MAKMMKAAVVEKFGQPLVVRDVPIPTPGPGQALVKSWLRGSVTRTCMLLMEIGRFSRCCRLFRVTRERESWRR